MQPLDRRRLLTATVAAGAALSAPRVLACAAARPRPIIWTFDNLRRIGGHPVRVQGAPGVEDTLIGPALRFDGVDDAIFIENHPLAGARAFTAEALFRPDGGAFEQRWLHLEGDPIVVPPAKGGHRMLFEIRVAGDRWYQDTFLFGDGYRQQLISPDKTWPIGRWHHVAQTCDGTNYRHYVNGVLQGEAQIAFKLQPPGRASVGIRLTGTSPFNGLVRQAAFTRDAALSPERFVLPIPKA